MRLGKSNKRNEAAKQQIYDKFREWHRSPLTFVSEVLKADPDKWQQDALNSLVADNKIAIRSGHGVGKTAFMAWACLWFASTHYPFKGVATAPTSTQLKDVLWAEISAWLQKMPEWMRERLELTSTYLRLKADPDNAFITARTARKEKPEALQGIHSENTIILIDEASGVDEVIFEAGQGSLSTPDAKILMASNPTRNQGYFHQAFHSMAAQWKLFNVSCETSKFVDPNYCASLAKTYGQDSDFYRVRVLGDFPLADSRAYIPINLCESAVNRDVDAIDHLPVWGLDVARFGDCKSALAKRKGNVLMDRIKTFYKRDLMETCGWVAHEYEEADERPSEILVDSIGIGAGVVDRLRELGLPVRGVNVGERAFSQDCFNLRADLWRRAREWFDSRDCRIPNDTELIGDLCSVYYKFSSAGKLQIESKEEMIKRLRHSPDVADAFVLTMAGSIKRTESEKYKRFISRAPSAPSAWVY